MEVETTPPAKKPLSALQAFFLVCAHVCSAATLVLTAVWADNDNSGQNTKHHMFLGGLGGGRRKIFAWLVPTSETRRISSQASAAHGVWLLFLDDSGHSVVPNSTPWQGNEQEPARSLAHNSDGLCVAGFSGCLPIAQLSRQTQSPRRQPLHRTRYHWTVSAIGSVSRSSPLRPRCVIVGAFAQYVQGLATYVFPLAPAAFRKTSLSAHVAFGITSELRLSGPSPLPGRQSTQALSPPSSLASPKSPYSCRAGTMRHRAVVE